MAEARVDVVDGRGAGLGEMPEHVDLGLRQPEIAQRSLEVDAHVMGRSFE